MNLRSANLQRHIRPQLLCLRPMGVISRMRAAATDLSLIRVGTCPSIFTFLRVMSKSMCALSNDLVLTIPGKSALPLGINMIYFCPRKCNNFLYITISCIRLSKIIDTILQTNNLLQFKSLISFQCASLLRPKQVILVWILNIYQMFFLFVRIILRNNFIDKTWIKFAIILDSKWSDLTIKILFTHFSCLLPNVMLFFVSLIQELFIVFYSVSARS